ncbi:MAG: hypothetical protein EBR82_50715 [Caulobacteraceae bacterium]|nr:hypothetical protein [Caulobacteraceae bacterium]
MLNMFKVLNLEIYIIQLRMNCMMVKKELKLFLVTIKKTIQNGLIEEKDQQLRLQSTYLTVQ